MNKVVLDYVEFYITNVCNFSCDNCNRFNNYYFSGQQKWSDYKDIYKEWSTKIDLQIMKILGGEPTLNPTFMDWVDGISNLWPNTTLHITTNGSRFNKTQDLYYILKKHKSKSKVFVSIHSEQLRDNIIHEAKNFLKGKIDTELINNTSHTIWKDRYDIIKDISWPDCDTPDGFKHLPSHIQEECINVHNFSAEMYIEKNTIVKLTDSNGIEVILQPSYQFNSSSIKLNNISKSFELYNSNPTSAHNICYSKKCHHFIKGKLYQCFLVGLLPEFINQFNVTISNSDLTLLNSYKPLTIDDDMNTMRHFVDNIRNKIPQCKFCPSSFDVGPLNALAKKTRLPKKI